MKVCSSCKEKKPTDQFGNNKTTHDGKQPYCKKCSSAKDKAHYQRSHKRRANIRKGVKTGSARARCLVLEYLKEHPCIDCGEHDPVVLEFDHRHSKSVCISSMLRTSYGVETIKAEIAKCDVRCANCHRRKTAKERGYYKFKGL